VPARVAMSETLTSRKRAFFSSKIRGGADQAFAGLGALATHGLAVQILRPLARSA